MKKFLCKNDGTFAVVAATVPFFAYFTIYHGKIFQFTRIIIRTFHAIYNKKVPPLCYFFNYSNDVNFPWSTQREIRISREEVTTKKKTLILMTVFEHFIYPAPAILSPLLLLML